MMSGMSKVQTLWGRIKRILRYTRCAPAAAGNDKWAARWVGDYSRWQDARRDSDGYDTDVILDKTLKATLRAKEDETVFERDSVLLERPEYPFFLLTSVLYVAALQDNSITVMDFGGALGSSYFQCRKFLSVLRSVRWCVVEQKKHVECGRRLLEDDILRFYYSVEECLEHEKCDMAILSGVIHVVAKPYQLIDRIIDSRFPYVVVDRQPLSAGQKERLCVMHVPPHIYDASYPYWFLSESRFREALRRGYTIEAESEGSPIVCDGQEISRKAFFCSLNDRGPEGAIPDRSA